MRRLAITFFYDEHGVVDEYMMFLLRELRKDIAALVFVSNGPINDAGTEGVSQIVDRLVIRENLGFDVWAYKAILESFGSDELDKFDEILLLNHTFYGPIFPFSEMFREMDQRNCDFWGVTAHKEVIPNPFTGNGRLPYHINSYFIAVRRRMFSSDVFRGYWNGMGPIDSYEASILKHEALFTEHFCNMGYRASVYIDPERFTSDHPAFLDVDSMIELRCPVLKRRILFHDPIFHNANAVDLPRAIELIRAHSNYDLGLIWANALRISELRKLYTNAALLSVLPDSPTESPKALEDFLRVAVCAHIYYIDLLPELLTWVSNIPTDFELIATTDTEEKKTQIEIEVGRFPRIKNVFVRIVEQNRGRDMSALFITCRDFFLDDRYDVVCRVHTKKSPQVNSTQSKFFKRHLLENLLDNEGYVANILGLFRSEQNVGLVIPPIIHIGYPTLGHSWFINRTLTEKLARRLRLGVLFDESTPIAAYGGMFWFRPKALRKLFAEKWEWDEFAEPTPVDGALGHALERLIAYTAQDAGYVTHTVMTSRQAAKNYVMLEYRLQRICSLLPLGTVNGQISVLEQIKFANYLRSRIAARIARWSPASYRVIRSLYQRLRDRG